MHVATQFKYCQNGSLCNDVSVFVINFFSKQENEIIYKLSLHSGSSHWRVISSFLGEKNTESRRLGRVEPLPVLGRRARVRGKLLGTGKEQ